MKEEFLILQQVLVVVLLLVLVVVLEWGQQAGDVADAFGDALPEEHLGAQSQVLGVFDEAETDHGPLASAQLVLQRQRERRLRDVVTRGVENPVAYKPTFP